MIAVEFEFELRPLDSTRAMDRRGSSFARFSRFSPLAPMLLMLLMLHEVSCNIMKQEARGIRKEAVEAG